MRISQVICDLQQEGIKWPITKLILETSIVISIFIKIGFPVPEPPVCLEALGMQNKQIPDAAITASTEYDNTTKAHYGRLHFLRKSERAGGWAAQSNVTDQFLQVNFGGWRKVTRVVVQGREDEDQWVKEFSLSYGYDSVFFQDYSEDEVKKVCLSK